MTHKRAKFLFDAEVKIKKKARLSPRPLSFNDSILRQNNGLREQLRTISTISFRSIQSVVRQL